MKKNISINISGIIFHIEEDGYENLKNYLESINSYFSSYEESEEIIADIESRIAEIFLLRLSDGQQVVSSEDVDNLVKTMGNITDFEAMEDDSDFSEQTENIEKGAKKHKASDKKPSGGTQQQQSQQSRQTFKSRTLKRDLNNQKLGGVAAGLAHYFRIDPIWLRVLFLISALAGGISLIVYFILWIVVPGSNELEENTSIKKLYRNPDDRVLGGVSSGLAKFLKMDAITVRIIFIVLFFGAGTGLLAYLILWAVTPEAQSLTDKMQMKGEKVTLSNIDENIKKQNTKNEFGAKDEGAFTKILLFPFRLIGKIVSGLSKALAPIMLFLVAAVRIFVGGIISIMGLSFMVAVLAIAGIALGFYNNDFFLLNDEWGFIPYEVVEATFPPLGVIAVLLVAFIPCFYLFTAGITVIAKRKVMSTSVGWSVLGVWLISLVIVFATVPNVFRDFTDESEITNSETIKASGGTLVLRLEDYYDYSRNRADFYDIDLEIIPSKNNLLTLDTEVRSRGRSVRDARENAAMVEYNLDVKDSVLSFPDYYEFKRDGKFRLQEMHLTLRIPEGQPFTIDRDMRELLERFSWRYRWSQLSRNTWVFKDGNLECVSCSE